MKRFWFISVLVMCAVSAFSQGIEPIQFQSSTIKNGTFRAVFGALNEDGDSVWYYNHVAFPETGAGVDSVKCVGDTLRVLTGGTWLKTAIDCSKTNELQNLAIDSTGRTFTVSISNGNSVKFKDREGVTSVTAQAPLTGGTITGSGTIGVDTSVLATQYDLTLIGGGMDSTFNGNRAISRIYQVGTNTGANTLREMFEWMYIGNYTQPTLTFNTVSPTLVEVGSSTAYTLTGSTNNPCNYTLANGALSAPATHSFGSATTFSKSYTHLPTTHGTTTITASQDWTMTTTSCVAGSPTSGTKTASRSIVNAYPVLWGMSATEYTSGSVPYNIWSKRVVDPATSPSITALTMTGTNQYIYILIPTAAGDFTVSSIIDHNGFSVGGSFTAYDVTVTSTGLTTNWTTGYKLYKLNNLTTASGFNYVYNR